MSPAILLVLVPLVFGVIGGKLAYNRGRNPLVWGAGSALFPICIMIVWFEKPHKEVQGHFRRCASCGEWIKWAEDPCRYCAAGYKNET
ncbi:MAG: hypothetical protein FIA91_10890 [Geobacter sp.]|nr:hypothetical protein [Geobacter sp.]